MAACAHSDDENFARLRADFPGWYFWRAVRTDGLPGEWVATRIASVAGVSATVMQPSPESLRVALADERAQAEARGRD